MRPKARCATQRATVRLQGPLDGAQEKGRVVATFGAEKEPAQGKHVARASCDSSPRSPG
jgi:hypothetical protein